MGPGVTYEEDQLVEGGGGRGTTEYPSILPCHMCAHRISLCPSHEQRHTVAHYISPGGLPLSAETGMPLLVKGSACVTMQRTTYSRRLEAFSCVCRSQGLPWTSADALSQVAFCHDPASISLHSVLIETFELKGHAKDATLCHDRLPVAYGVQDPPTEATK